MTTVRRCPACRHTVSSDECTHCPECSAALDFVPAESGRQVHDILRTVRKQMDPLDAVAGVPAAGDRDVAAILSATDFQALLDESLSDAEDAPEAHAGKPAGPPAEAPGSAPPAGGSERASPFGTALGSMQPRHAAPADGHAGQSQGGPETWNPHPVMIDAPDPAAAGAQPDSPAPRPRTWQGATRQTIYLLLVLLACIFLFRLLGPKKKEPSIDDLFQPGKTDIEFLDAINYLEKYYEQHPELKRGNVVQKADEAEESGPGGGTAGDASSADRAPDAAASAESAP